MCLSKKGAQVGVLVFVLVSECVILQVANLSE